MSALHVPATTPPASTLVSNPFVSGIFALPIRLSSKVYLQVVIVKIKNI